MCTAISLKTNDTYFGRNLDYDFSYGEEIVVTPRGYSFPLRNGTDFRTKYAINGVAYVINQYPLYYDAINEKGLGVAGLNFVGNAHYFEPIEGKDNVTQFEFIPWLLGQCANVDEAISLLQKINITNISFSPELPAAEQHWMISDAERCIVVECVSDGVHIYDNPTKTLTNNPPFDKQLFRLNDYMDLSAYNGGNRFSNKIELVEYSRGMGAIGLPGDLSSGSRFVRGAFTNLNSICADDEMSSISQFFHVLDSVAQTRGCCDLGDGKYEITLYSSCYNLQKGICYYTTYENRQINAVDMNKVDLNGVAISRYSIMDKQNVNHQN